MQRAAPVESITELIRALVRIPSRAGEDDLARICQCVEDWLRGRGIDFKVLLGRSGERLGIYCEIAGAAPGRWTVLNATLDTAGFGEPSSWTFGPTEARVVDGWLYGRGSADSKAAVALFSHLLLEWQRDRSFAGRIGVLFDCDEHSGRFGGAHAFFDHPHDAKGPPRPDGVLIGYPGMNLIVAGCRGFLRCRLQVHGIAAHSGSARDRGVNAVSRALALGQRLQALPLPAASDDFPLPPQVTITGIRGGGEGFSQIPDLCEMKVDMRLTPAFTDASARAAVGRVVAEVDAQCAQAQRTEIAWVDGWRAYRVPASHPLVSAMREACRAELGTDVPVGIVGPSNIGNYLSSLGVPALCGFGVRDEGIHAANERIELASIEPVYNIYRDALRRLHHA
ncbi:MAG TPA: M20 family metallopeptidase [Burkholderiaceae bacterium]|nr:M20 family metallopeptidase [Burkholderiaceae bacterium]